MINIFFKGGKMKDKNEKLNDKDKRNITIIILIGIFAWFTLSGYSYNLDIARSAGQGFGAALIGFVVAKYGLKTI